MQTLRIIIAGILLNGALLAQNGGTIKGTITNEKNEPQFMALVALIEDTTIIAGVNTDESGNYTIRQIVPGKYTVRVYYTGYKTSIIKNVLVDQGMTAYVNSKMRNNDTLGVIVVTSEYHAPVIDNGISTVTRISMDQIEHIAVGKNDIVGMIVGTTPGVLPTPDGQDLYIRGSRQGTTGYYIDGAKVMSGFGVPGMGIAEIQVLTGGVPAEYGDCTGGYVIITTKDYKWEMHKREMEREARQAAIQPAGGTSADQE